jgi:hypothetical protein
VFIPGALYQRLFASMTRLARARDATLGTALGYASLNIVCKAANLSGSLRCLGDMLQNRRVPRDDLIVYRRS